MIMKIKINKEIGDVKKLLFVASALLSVIMMPGYSALAAQRNYVWTEEYGTLAKGNAEFEFYNTAVTHDIQTRNASDWEQKFELEYGITDHLNASIYQVYAQPVDGSGLKYVGYNIELKYRIAEANKLPVDILLYAENEVTSIEGNRFEGKIIFAKDVGSLNLTYNQIYEREYSTGREEHEYAAALSYEVKPWLRLGAESKGSYTNDEYAIGPTVAWMGNRIWIDIGAVFGLNRTTNDREVRFLLGIPF